MPPDDDGKWSWPLSFPQRGCLVREAQRGRAAYGPHVVFESSGGLPVPRLRYGLQQLLARHPVLRCRIDERARQSVVDAALPPVPLAVHEGLSAPDFDAMLRNQRSLVFDRSVPPLWNCLLLRGRAGREVLAFAFDHLLVDGTSLQVFFEDLAAVSAGSMPPDPSSSYAGFAAWQQSVFASCDSPSLDFLRAQLASTPPNRPVDLPFCLDPEGPLSGVVQRSALVLDERERDALRGSAARYRMTPFMVMLGAILHVLALVSGNGDLTVRVPVAGRPAGFERTLGWFANDLVLRLRCADGPDLAAVLERTRAMWLAFLPHHTTPYDLVLDCVEPARRITRYRPAIVTVNSDRPIRELSLLGTRLNRIPQAGAAAEAGLHFLLGDSGGEVELSCTTDASRFRRADVEHLLRKVADSLLTAS